MVDKGDLLLSGFLLGSGFGMAMMVILQGHEWNHNYKNLLRTTKSLIGSQDGILTVTDLALEAQISPAKAAKFLKKLALQLEIEPDVDDTGAIFYVINTGKNISVQQRLKKKLLS